MMILLLRAIRADIDSRRAYSKAWTATLNRVGLIFGAAITLRSKKRQLWSVICP